MGRLTDYKIVTGTDIKEFQEEVRRLPIGQWRPAGSLATSVIHSEEWGDLVVYSQAFIQDQ